MPGLQGDHAVASPGSPVKRSRLSLKFFQRKETKRALDFSVCQTDEPKNCEPEEPEASSCPQVVFGPSLQPSSPSLLPCGKRESLLPFVGFSNLGNTCYLNSVLQVLYYCPGFREGIKKLHSLCSENDKLKEGTDTNDEVEDVSEPLPAHIELLVSFNSLITSVEQLQSNFLLNHSGVSEGELATTPRNILQTLRRLNPMYEGYLQHDAQEVLQCLLVYVQEACDTINKELKMENDDVTEVKDLGVSSSLTESKPLSEEEEQVNGKRKSDTEVGNAKKRPKSLKSKKTDSVEDILVKNLPLRRSKRKSSNEIIKNSTQKTNAEEEEATTKANRAEEHDGTRSDEKVFKETDGKKKRAKLSWLRPSGKQPSIFSKFCSLGKISSSSVKNEPKIEDKPKDEQNENGALKGPPQNMPDDQKAMKQQDVLGLRHVFQGQLVLRTRCLECESFTERREDFQDISVPVLDEQPSSPDKPSKVSPDPKPELKTLNWAIAQFASVERIVGEDKYFCETCHHYTEAERSLLFDKTPEVVTIHLKRFSASSLEFDRYASLSKVNTPLHTPLTLSLEEWCTKSSATKGQTYQLFAVIMHSGVTISMGHYTAYIRMSDMKDLKLLPQEGKEPKEDTQEERHHKEDSQGKDSVLDYDDGEVSFSVRGRSRTSSAGGKTGCKKLSEGSVGLLGGQRSVSSVEQGKGKHTEKAGSSEVAEGPKQGKTNGVSEGTSMEASAQQALNGLKGYEGKWLHFDDSEVRLFEEEEFLRACSPETSSSSTPYLLFYRRLHPGH